jgi:hypothetical protein
VLLANGQPADVDLNGAVNWRKYPSAIPCSREFAASKEAINSSRIHRLKSLWANPVDLAASQAEKPVLYYQPQKSLRGATILDRKGFIG